MRWAALQQSVIRFCNQIFLSTTASHGNPIHCSSFIEICTSHRADTEFTLIHLHHHHRLWSERRHSCAICTALTCETKFIHTHTAHSPVSDYSHNVGRLPKHIHQIPRHSETFQVIARTSAADKVSLFHTTNIRTHCALPFGSTYIASPVTQAHDIRSAHATHVGIYIGFEGFVHFLWRRKIIDGRPCRCRCVICFYFSLIHFD